MPTFSVTGWRSAEPRPYKAVREVLIDATTSPGLSLGVRASPVFPRVFAPRAGPPSRPLRPCPCQSGGNSGGNFSGVGRVAIGVCTAHRPEMLKCCLSALASQVIPEGFEVTIIVADNEPEPDNQQAVAEFALTCPFPVQYVHEP